MSYIGVDMLSLKCGYIMKQAIKSLKNSAWLWGRDLIC